MANDGLLSNIATNPLLQIGAGLLSVAGPSRQPQSLGTGLLRGLTAAQQAQQAQLRNQAVREQLEARARQREAQQRLAGLLQPGISVDTGALPTAGDIAMGAGPEAVDAAVTEVPMQGLLNAGGFQSPEVMGLLAQAAPEQFTQSLMGAAFPNDRRQNSLIEQAQFAFPDDPDRQREFVETNAGQGDVATQLDLLTARQRQIEIENELRDRQERDESREAKRGKLISSVRRDLNDAKRLAEINNELRGTAGEAGIPLPELRRAAISGAGAVGGLLGVDNSRAQEIVNLMDEFSKISTRFSAQSAVDLFDSGNITNFQLQSIQDATPNISIAPDANARIIADSMETILGGADRADIKIKDRGKFEALIRELRGEPSDGGSETRKNPRSSSRKTGGVRFLGFE